MNALCKLKEVGRRREVLNEGRNSLIFLSTGEFYSSLSLPKLTYYAYLKYFSVLGWGFFEGSCSQTAHQRWCVSLINSLTSQHILEGGK